MAEQIIDPMSRFEKAKSQAKQETFASKQAAQEAINRRFAQMGMQGSGAAIKQQSLIDQQSEEELGKRLEGISGMQEQEIARQNEIKQAREFQTKEREASQGYATQERMAGQEYGNLMLQRQQDYATREREAGQGFVSAQTKSAQDYAASQQEKQNTFAKSMDEIQGNRFAEQMKLERDKFNYDKVIGDFNMNMAKSEANKQDIFGKGESMVTDFLQKFKINPMRTPTAKEAAVLIGSGLGGLATIPAVKEVGGKIFGGLTGRRP